MALSKADALVAAREILSGPRVQEAERLRRIHDAMQPCRRSGEFIPTVQVPKDAPPLMKELARKSETNYLPLLVKTYRQVIKADGYYSESDPDSSEPWVWWQRNRMDSRQTGLVHDALTYGASYATVLPGTYGRNQPGPSISLYSPREMTALYQDPNADEWPIMALCRDGNIVTLIDDEMIYRFGVEPKALNRWYEPAATLEFGAGILTYLDAEAHELGVCPVVRYRDRNLLAGEESYGIVEPLLTINERITETTFQAMVVQYTQAFMQRYVLGWVPESEQQELKVGAARIWYFPGDKEEIEIGQLSAGTVDLKLREASIRDFAAQGQIPAQALGIDGISNISDATLAGLEAAKNRESGEIQTSLGESHEQLLRLCAYIDGNDAAADDYNSELRWRDYEARSFAQTVDGLVKLVQGGILAPEIVLEDVPGMTEQKLARAVAALRKAEGSRVIDRLLAERTAVDSPVENVAASADRNPAA
ncbi:phage portal protein [Antrihabitans sp. YC3-6]|uniref:Phage portal protein n=1 Tax=Antrihabitans stalagmiti TaxID=2799499 RepID=A0A934NWP7_9NOCA|nr:phage portal protein [Antrihabitans stalagmiti]MBJ8342786.1 phage portal protein [Antrihabitans stalagmiti]